MQVSKFKEFSPWCLRWDCYVPGCRLANYCALATNFFGKRCNQQPVLPSRRLRPTMAGNPWVIEAQDDIRAPIGEEDAAKVIGTSLHGRYDIVLPGSGARSIPNGRRLVAPCRQSSRINFRIWYFLPPRRMRGICSVCLNALSRRLCSCVCASGSRSHQIPNNCQQLCGCVHTVPSLVKRRSRKSTRG